MAGSATAVRSVKLAAAALVFRRFQFQVLIHVKILPEPLRGATVSGLAGPLCQDYLLGMQIDQDERRHSHLYELKPVNRLWLLPPIGLALLGLGIGGFDNPSTLAALVGGVGIGFALILAFPKYWLSRLD